MIEIKERLSARCRSQRVHRLNPMSGHALPVLLTASDNGHLQYPVRGVIVAFEQGVLLTLSQAVFHCAMQDGSLGPPVTVRNPVFTYDGLTG